MWRGKSKPMLNSRQKKKRLFLSLCVSVLSLMVINWGFEHTGKYLSWKKAVMETLRMSGYGEPGEFLLQRDGTTEVYGVGFFNRMEERPEKYVVTKVEKSTAETYLVSVQVIRNGFLWEPVRFNSEFYNMELQAWYQSDMELMLGLCENPNVTEVTMKWGHWMEDAKGNWVTYDMGKATYPIGEDGFFYQEVDESRASVDDKGRKMLIQTTYLEGRDKNGKILYRQGIDDEGRSFVNNEEVQ